MSSLAAKIKEARTQSTSVGPRAFLVPPSVLGASLIAVAATDGYEAPTHAPAATQGTNGTVTEMAPEAHAVRLDVPPPPPLATLRTVEAELAGLEAVLDAPAPLPRVPLYRKPRRGSRVAKKPSQPVLRSKNTSEPIVRVKKMTEPIVRMKNGNGTHKTSPPVVQVVVKKRTPAPDAPEKALAWLHGMVKKVNVGAIPTMLDYYRRLGWIPNESYGWLVELATGLTKSAQPATWRMVKNDPAELATIHRESYKHLKGLFGERMNRSV